MTTINPVSAQVATIIPVTKGNSFSYISGSNSTLTASTATAGAISCNDILISGTSLKDSIEAINKRLSILVPDLNKLEKYAALKAAYDQYKLLEMLINDDK